MNPCPLKACCSIWGQCGFSKDFCIDTNTGPPGTAAPGTYGCISNCGGLDIKKGDGTGAIKIGYFQGYNLGRECLYQDVYQIDMSRYTHIHFAFGTLTPSFEVEVGGILSTYHFNEFRRSSTYTIFRNGVMPAGRLTMATNIANFIKQHDLDGVDIDWKYPGVPNLPESDPGKSGEGINYPFFLVALKNLLPGRTVSIAAAPSYWYLKQYPIEAMGAILDYIVFMTYDLHGQTPFPAPTGIGSLGNYGTTKEELIQGSVRTWIKNGSKNRGNSALPDPDDGETMDDLIDGDMTLPGYVRLPVCSPERAWQSWDTSDSGSSENYPCDMPPGISHCGDSTFVDQTSDASPNADDCFGIIRDIEGDGRTDWTTSVVEGHREIGDHRSCHFGVEVVYTNVNGAFKVGGGDVRDIITDAVAKFRRPNGKVGAKGEMYCNGNLPGNGVRVLWGIY